MKIMPYYVCGVKIKSPIRLPALYNQAYALEQVQQEFKEFLELISWHYWAEYKKFRNQSTRH
jgi:hypothetical protein